MLSWQVCVFSLSICVCVFVCHANTTTRKTEGKKRIKKEEETSEARDERRSGVEGFGVTTDDRMKMKIEKETGR